jgi:sterol desaturase/sphingolipid hydroxylase (fatty acid hydroxylase superfamily)
MDRIAIFLHSKGAVVVTVLVLLLIAERLFPVARGVGGLGRVAKNLSLGGLNAIVSWAVVVPVSAFAVQWAIGWRPAILTGWPGLALDIVILDLWIYWWHRANHEIPMLWRFHQVHHLDEFLDASSALRFHFGEVLLSSLVRAGVIFVAAVPLASVIVFETMIALVTMFHHSNLRLPGWLERPVSLVMVTPSIHWVHHHAIRADTDSNYSTLFSLWDRLFASRSMTLRTPQMPIGIEGRKDEGLAGLVTRPAR